MDCSFDQVMMSKSTSDKKSAPSQLTSVHVCMACNIERPDHIVLKHIFLSRPAWQFRDYIDPLILPLPYPTDILMTYQVAPAVGGNTLILLIEWTIHNNNSILCGKYTDVWICYESFYVKEWRDRWNKTVQKMIKPL